MIREFTDDITTSFLYSENAIYQDIQNKLLLILTEYPFDLTQGVDWSGLLGANPVNLSDIEAAVKGQVYKVVGVKSITAYNAEQVGRHKLLLSLSVSTTHGDVTLQELI